MGPFRTHWRPDLLVAAMILGSCVTTYAQEPAFGFGKPATPADVRAADTTVGPEGKELPPGSGTAVQGAAVFGLRG
jgi:cytochrome c